MLLYSEKRKHRSRHVSLQSGTFHIGRHVYRFDPVELRTDGRGTARRRRSAADDDDNQQVDYRISTTLIEHDPHAGNN